MKIITLKPSITKFRLRYNSDLAVWGIEGIGKGLGSEYVMFAAFKEKKHGEVLLKHLRINGY